MSEGTGSADGDGATSVSPDNRLAASDGGGVLVSIRGGRSSSIDCSLVFWDGGFFENEYAVGGLETFSGGSGALCFLENQPFFLGSSPLTTIRSSSKSGSCHVGWLSTTFSGPPKKDIRTSGSSK